MPDPNQPQAGGPPSGAPAGPPTGAPPSPPPGGGGGNPLSSLMQGGQTGTLLSMLLSFLAGSGLNSTMSQVSKFMGMMNKGGSKADPTRKHEGGVQMKAAPPQNPGTNSISPELLQRAQQDPQLMQQLMALMQRGQGGGQTPPQAGGQG